MVDKQGEKLNMINEIKKLVLKIDVKDLSIEDLYYYILILEELDMIDYHYTDTLSSEDYD